MSVKNKKNVDPKLLEMEELRKEVDSLVVLVQALKTSVERVPSQVDALVKSFHGAITQLSSNYELRDSGNPTTVIVSNVLKVSGSIETELSSATRQAFHEKTFAFLKIWLDTLLKLQIRFTNLDKSRQSFDHYTKKVKHLLQEREKRKARGKGEDQVHIEKMARNEEKLRTAAGQYHTDRQQLITLVKAALAAKVPYLNQVYHNFSETLRLCFNSGLHETEPFATAVEKLTKHMAKTRRDMLVETMHAEELMDQSSRFRQAQGDIDAARGRDKGRNSPKAADGAGDDEEMEKDDYWTTGSAANSGWDVEPRGESDDDSYGDSDDDGFGHSGASSPQRSTGGSGSGSSGDKGGFAGGNDDFGFFGAPSPSPAPSTQTVDDDWMSFSAPAPAPVPARQPDLYSKPMPAVPQEPLQPVRRKGPYIWDYNYNLWRHQSNGTYYNERTKLYTRNPAGGQWLRLVNGQLVP